MSFTDTLEAYMLNALCNDIPYSATALWIGLWIGNPGETGSGGAEVSGSGYVRVDAYGKWGIPVLSTIVNDTVILFPEALNNWGSVTHFSLHTLQSGGFMLAHGPLQGAPINITVGSIPRFAASSMAITLD